MSPAATFTLMCSLLLAGTSCASSRCVTAETAPAVVVAERPSPITAELDAYIRKAMRDWNVPGLAIAVVQNDSVVFAQGYGVRTVGQSAEVDTRTIFGLMSPTKAFTTTALAMLAEEGRLSWDDPVVQHLPHFRLGDSTTTREIRIRDLVSHRSGYADAPRLWYGRTDRSPEELVETMADLDPVAPMRAEFHYNNLMYVVAGEVIEAASGLTWQDFVQQRIFAPLQMNRSTTSVKALEMRSNVASPHARRVFKRFGPIRPIAYVDADNMAPAATIHSNVLEIATWLRMHLNEGRHEGGRLVSASAIRELQRPHVALPRGSGVLCGTVRSRSYGLGWFVQEYRGRTAVVHGGGFDGQRSAVGMLPEEGLGVVVLSNMHETEIAQALVYRTFDMFLGVEPRDWSGAYLDQ